MQCIPNATLSSVRGPPAKLLAHRTARPTLLLHNQPVVTMGMADHTGIPLTTMHRTQPCSVCMALPHMHAQYSDISCIGCC
jgi:hypothetical protein